jgi:hypothetical protein
MARCQQNFIYKSRHRLLSVYPCSNCFVVLHSDIRDVTQIKLFFGLKFPYHLSTKVYESCTLLMHPASAGIAVRMKDSGYFATLIITSNLHGCPCVPIEMALFYLQMFPIHHLVHKSENKMTH